MASEGEDQLQRAAEKRRAREASEAAKKPKVSLREVEARGAEKQRRHRLREALAESGRVGKVTSTLALLTGLLGPTTVGLIFFDVKSLLVEAAIVGITAVSAFGMLSLHEQIFGALRLRALRRTGYGLDVDAYLRALSENRQSAELVVRVSFGRAWPREAQSSAPDAVREWMPLLARVAWSGQVLVLSSANIEGTQYLSGGDTAGERFFNNAAIHGCFMGVVRQVLPKLAAVAPISLLEVELVGSIEAWDAEP